jgi:tripartite-type tricarboxylate transporter receptor subunit TctC
MLSLLCRAALLLTAFFQSQALADPYPDKPIRVIVPVPAGGSPDVTARLIAPGLAKVLGQQLVIDNRAGAGSLIGTELAARAAPDGYTLLLSSGGPLTILPHLQKNVAYDALRDFAPIGLIASGPFVLVAHPSATFKSIKELAAVAKAAPGKLYYASAGNGSPNHLATELFKNMSGLDITHVPYKGAPQGVTDVLAGHINLNLSSIPPVLNHIRAGRLQALAISGAKRSPQLGEVPTVSETLARGYEFNSWFGLLAPARTPKAIVAQLSAALSKVVHSADIRAQFESQGAEPVGSSADEFAAFIRREFDKNGRIAKLAAIKVD